VFDLLTLGDDDRDPAASGPSDVLLRLRTPVDRETQSVFSVTLVAVDAGTPRRSASLPVTDAPRFDPPASDA